VNININRLKKNSLHYY